MKKPFIPRADADKDLWLTNFSSKLSGYGSKYSLRCHYLPKHRLLHLAQ